MDRTELIVEAGSVGILRLYDIAYAADLARVDEILRRDATVAAHRKELTRAEPKAIAFDVPPVQLALGPVRAPAGDSVELGQAFARVYDFGVLSVHLRFFVDNCTWSEFTRRTNDLDQWAGSEEAAEIWSALRREATRLIEPALVRPSDSELEEDYLLVTINRLNEELNAEALLDRVDPVPLLTGDLQPLSSGARTDILRHTYSYFETDLAILSWDRALIFELSPDSDVAEVTETREKVDSALKVTEDVYVARVYSAALELFRIRARAANVDRKLGIIRDTYQALYDEAATERSEILTITIIVLIAFEIVLSFIR